MMLGAWHAFNMNSTTLFPRYGAITTILAALMTYRALVRGVFVEYLRFTGIADEIAFHPFNPLYSKSWAKEEDYRALKAGICVFIAGTLVWAFGDLLPV